MVDPADRAVPPSREVSRDYPGEDDDDDAGDPSTYTIRSRQFFDD